ncbi:MAG: hypothetical protein J0M34_09030 [Alphaproteobacteria bacterium]|nr:hypothetical protein [Alphaproteobacteria bacterium]
MTESNTSAVRPDLEPPKESRNSIVLNSIGNGMMLGGIPLLAIEGYNALRPTHKAPPKVHLATIAAAVVGGVMGLVYGEKEATRLENYRLKVAGEVTKLSNEVEQLKAEKRNWQERAQEEPQHPAATHTLT